MGYVASIGTNDCDNRPTAMFLAIIAQGAIYQLGNDGLWHKYETDSDGVFGEITAPQAGAPPF